MLCPSLRPPVNTLVCLGLAWLGLAWRGSAWRGLMWPGLAVEDRTDLLNVAKELPL